MNLILDDPSAVPYFTDMPRMLEAIGVDAGDYDWFVSDVETSVGANAFPVGDGWISGVELRARLESMRIQFVWAVFSAVDKGRRFEVESPPCADGNVSFWDSAGLKPQLPDALFEIVCWDSDCTLFIGLPEPMAERLIAAYPAARALGH